MSRKSSLTMVDAFELNYELILLRENRAHHRVRRSYEDHAVIDDLVVRKGIQHRRALAPKIIAVRHLARDAELGVAIPQIPIPYQIRFGLAPGLFVGARLTDAP